MKKLTDDQILQLAAECQQPHFDQMFDPSVSPRHRCEINEILTNAMGARDADDVISSLEANRMTIIQTNGFNYTLWLIDGRIAAKVERNAWRHQ